MQEQKSIAIIGSRGIPAEFGGFETFAEQLAVRLVEKGIKVTVFCEDSQNYKQSEYKGVKLIYVKTVNIVGIRSVWFDLVNIVRTLKGYDMVYMLGYHAAFAFVLPWLFRTNFWVNMDGLEWKRDKWSPFAKRYLKVMEGIAAIFAKKLVADAQGIADHLHLSYKVANKTVMIPYGADIIEHEPDSRLVNKLGIICHKYYLIVCRLEPENHVQEIIQGFIESKVQKKLIVVGDHKTGTEYVKGLIELADKRVSFMGAIYDQPQLTALRYYCKAYIHGHSVGGTNPSLLEAMAAGNYIIAHDNVFNHEVTGGHASFFKHSSDLSETLNALEDKEVSIKVKNQLLNRIKTIYNWENIANIYQNEIISHNTGK